MFQQLGFNRFQDEVRRCREEYGFRALKLQPQYHGLNPLSSASDFFFETAPIEGTAAPTRIWAIGDSGTRGLSPIEKASKVRDAYLALAGARPTDVWLALGDNAYYAGEDAEYQTQFFDQYPMILRQTAVWSTIGNHETYSQVQEGLLPYFRIFSFPSKGEAGGTPSRG